MESCLVLGHFIAHFLSISGVRKFDVKFLWKLKYITYPCLYVIIPDCFDPSAVT